MTPALLDGLTVLDFTRVLAGPYCTRLLADLGARVIKVERPGGGDDTRAFYLQLEQGRTDQSSYFVRFNAGKQSVAIDLAHPQARPLVLDLARASDVLIENFVPGIMARHGLDYGAVSAANPSIVYCSISGYGQSGPLRDRPAFAHLINAASGAMDLDRQGDPDRRWPTWSADALGGVHAFGLVLAAVLRRQRARQGACLDVMLQSLGRRGHRHRGRAQWQEFAKGRARGWSSTPSGDAISPYSSSARVRRGAASSPPWAGTAPQAPRAFPRRRAGASTGPNCAS